MNIAGYELRAAPQVEDPQRAAQAILDLLPGLRPGIGEDSLRARLDGIGRLLRWRYHRVAFLLDRTPAGPVHVKIYTPRNAFEVLVEMGASSRGLTSWRMGRALLAAGIPTPEPLLLLTRKPFRVHRESVLVARTVENAVVLAVELKTRAAAGQPVRSLLAGIAGIAADLHRAGFFHGDFTARNLVLAGPEGQRRLWLIDLDRTKNLRWLPAPLRRRVQLLDLRLLLLTTWSEITRREWLRLLVIYCKRAGFSRTARRAFAGKILSARRGRIRIGARVKTTGRPRSDWS